MSTFVSLVHKPFEFNMCVEAPLHLWASWCSHCNRIDWNHQIIQGTTARPLIIHLHQQLKKPLIYFTLSWRINDVKINSNIPVAGWELTWPSACTLLQPQQICEGPCPPCSARCRHWWPPRRRSGAARTGWWPPAQCLQRRSADTHSLHSLVGRFISAEFTDRLKTPCSYRTWANFLPMWDHVIVKRCSLDDTISTEYFLRITGMTFLDNLLDITQRNDPYWNRFQVGGKEWKEYYWPQYV